MNIILRLAWRNLWRQPRRTWLTIGAMVFSNALLVFMISIQFSTYELMIDNTLQAFTGHMQVQAPGYKDDFKIDLDDYNGKGRRDLPIPGTFIIGQDGIVKAAFADIDYTKRMEPAAIVEALKRIE